MTLLLGSILTSIFILFGVYSLASSSVLVSERSGTVNISIEGTMIMGAITQLVLLSPNGAGMIELGVVGILLSLLVAGAIGSIFGLLLGIAVITFKGDHVIVGTALNLLAPVLSLMIAITVFGTTSGGNSPPSPLRPGNFDYLSLVFMGIGIMVLFGSWFYLAKTKSGLRLKSAGENPYSLETAGVSVSRQRYMALIVAGFLGGMSGAMASHTFTNFQHTVTGMGFIAIAILIFGQWRVAGITLGVIIMAILFGTMTQWLHFGWSIPREVVMMIPYILPIVVLVFMKKSNSPRALGKSFKKDERD